MSNYINANASAAIPKLITFTSSTFREQINANYQRLMKDESKPIVDVALYAGGLFIFPPLLLPAIGRSFLRWKDRSSVRVTVLPEQTAAWLQLDPSPVECGLVYARHPYMDNRFISLANFHRILFDEKAQELTTLLIQLGASKISIQHIYGYRLSTETRLGVSLNQMNLSETSSEDYSSYQMLKLGDPVRVPNVPPNMLWLKYEPEWQVLVRERQERKLREYNLTLDYARDYGIDVGLKTQVQKLGLSVGGAFNEFRDTRWSVHAKFVDY